MELTLANLLGVDAPILIIIAVVVLFGGSQIPKFAKGLGQAKKEFEKGAKGDTSDDDEPDEKPKA